MIKKIVIVLFSMMGLIACSEGDTSDITGRVAMKGSSIHTYLVLEDTQTKKSVKLVNYKKFHLDQHQNEILTLKVKLLKKAIGPGFPEEVEVVEVK
ncbi:MAG TPA: hypothetical protein ENK98_00920 [Epsilonproteobacteria bacterium]|nr:hypothetical protein [Campylobacterota bacterium]